MRPSVARSATCAPDGARADRPGRDATLAGHGTMRESARRERGLGPARLRAHHHYIGDARGLHERPGDRRAEDLGLPAPAQHQRARLRRRDVVPARLATPRREPVERLGGRARRRPAGLRPRAPGAGARSGRACRGRTTRPRRGSSAGRGTGTAPPTWLESWPASGMRASSTRASWARRGPGRLEEGHEGREEHERDGLRYHVSTTPVPTVKPE